jgi:thiol-disulfide isomerase/thioredoxin
MGPFLPIHQSGGSCKNATHAPMHSGGPSTLPLVKCPAHICKDLTANPPIHEAVEFSFRKPASWIGTSPNDTTQKATSPRILPPSPSFHLGRSLFRAHSLSKLVHRRRLLHNECLATARMKRPFIAILAVVAGLAGLAIGMAASRVTHRNPRSLAPHVDAAHTLPVKSVAETPSTSSGSTPDVSPLIDDDDSGVIRFASNPQPAPPFLLNDLNGNVVSTAQWPGKVVMLNFWATWCPPCREEIPILVDLQKKYKDDLLVVGVSVDDGEMAEVKAFVKVYQINYPVVMWSRELVDEYGGVPALPTTFLINKQGRIVQKHEGLYSPDVYDTEVRALMGLQVSAKIETFEDTGQIFLKNAVNATELPDVDFSGLSPVQKTAALKRLNSENCNCGCRLTLAQCRINDTSCVRSKGLAAKIVREINEAGPPLSPAVPTPPTDN